MGPTSIQQSIDKHDDDNDNDNNAGLLVQGRNYVISQGPFQMKMIRKRSKK